MDKIQNSLIPPKNVVAALLLAAFVALSTGWISGLPDGRIRLTLLNTGGGSAVLLRTGGGEVALIGSGSDGSGLLNALGRTLPPLANRIDLLIFAGGKKALVAGAASLPGHYVVTAVTALGTLSNAEAQVLETMRRAGTAIGEIGASSFSWCGLDFIDAGAPSGTAALLVRSSWGSALLLSDLSAPDQDEIAGMQESRLRSGVVVGPPKGGVAMSLLQTAAPHFILIPTVQSSRDLTAWPGSRTFQTAKDGDVTCILSANGWSGPGP